MQPWWLDWTAGLFPVILAVFLLRSFLFEPFKIPSGSMMPTLLTGDLILVNKFTYGLRLPVINTKLTDGTPPARGDVMVFRYPPKPSLDYIKRVVGVPGDEVAYLNKKLTINGQPVSKQAVPEYFDEEAMRYFKQYPRKLGGKQHRLLNDDTRRAGLVRGRDHGVPESGKLPLQCRGRGVQGARGPLFHDGRQPRQFARLALLGFRSGHATSWARPSSSG